jgi:hypothetical protein
MRIPEETVEAVVSDVSKKMASPSYAQVAVGSFVQTQPNVSRYISAHSDDLGGGEAVIHLVFHAEVLAECFRRELGRAIGALDFSDLDAAHHTDPLAELGRRQPAIASYVASNLDDDGSRKLLAHVALAFDRAA